MEAATELEPTSPASPAPLPRENVYGSIKRLDWVRSHLRGGERILDLGCGTGYMITYPLLAEGRDVTGVDLDTASVELGRSILAGAGLPADRLRDERLEGIEGEFDVAIVSEVLEHQTDAQFEELLAAVASKLRPGGTLLVTVPNGYGWFELESFVWFRLRVGSLLRRLNLLKLAGIVNHRITGGYEDSAHPSSLDGSPHLQRFTRSSIRERLERAGFGVESVDGTVLFAGPFSATTFNGIGALMRLNNRLGSRFPARASGFLVRARKPSR